MCMQLNYPSSRIRRRRIKISPDMLDLKNTIFPTTLLENLFQQNGNLTVKVEDVGFRKQGATGRRIEGKFQNHSKA